MHVTISLFRSAKDNRAVRETVSFDEFLTDFREPAVEQLDPSPENVTVIKKAAPAFSPAIFKDDKRRKANVEQAQVLAFDIDEPVDAKELSDRLRRRNISFAIHHTTSAGFDVAETGRGSVHVLIPLSRPVDHDTYLRYWDEASRVFHGIEIDRSKRGAESLYFAPRIFEAHRERYFFDCVTDAPYLGASGFKPLRPERDALERYALELTNAVQKHVTLNRVAFTFGLLGVSLDDTKTRLIAALRDNVVSDPVNDWRAAEYTLEKAWTDGAAQKSADDARPKYIPPEAKATGRKALKEAVAAIGKGESLAAHAHRCGQFVPHILAKDETLDALRSAWERAKTHDTRSLEDAVRELVQGLENGMRSPKGLLEEWQKELKLNPDGLGFNPGENNVHVVLEKHPDTQGLVACDVREGGAPTYLVEPPWLRGQKLEYPRRVKDGDRQRVARWVRDELSVPQISVKTALTALVDVAAEHQYDALLDYYRSLPPAGRTDVLERVLIDTLGAEDTPYTRAVTKRWLIGVVARQFAPGCKMDNMLILVGEQGLGKSTWFRELFPAHLQDSCFDDSLNMLRPDKDQIVKLSQLAVVEVGELAAMSKADVETIKTVVSQRAGNERAAYAALHAKYPRRAVFGGSTNREEFLRDPTGNRRFWPLPCHRELDIGRLRGCRELLWGETVGAYLRGEPWVLTPEEERLAVGVRAGHEEEDVFVERIAQLLEQWPSDGKYEDPLLRTFEWQLEGGRLVRARVSQLLAKLGDDGLNRQTERRVGDCLRKLGWAARQEKHGDTRFRVWCKKPV